MPGEQTDTQAVPTSNEAPLALKNLFTPTVTHTRAARGAQPVVPSDTVDLPRFAYQGLYVGVAGAIKVDMIGGGTILFTNVPVGIFKIQVRRVYVTGTGASQIIALF
jgi:hypothetical protein